MKGSMKRRVIAGLLAFALVFSTAFSTTAVSTNAASKKAVKTVTLKIGKKKVTKKTYTLKQGAKATLKITVNPSSAKKSIAYKTSNKKIATVSKSGKITASKKKTGTAKITVTVTGKNKKKKSTYVKIKVVKKAAATTKAAPTTAATTTTAAATTTQAAATTTQAAAATAPAVKTIESLNSSTGVITVTFAQATNDAALKDTKLTVSDGTNTYEATFAGLKDGITATYKLPESVIPSLSEKTYTISSGTVQLPKNSTVKAVKDTKENVDGLSVTVANSLDDYKNTVLIGTNADLQVSLTKNGQVVPNNDVKIVLEPMYGHTPSQRSIFGFSDNTPLEQTVKTSADGTVKTTVGLLSDYNKLTATSGYYASYKVTATATGSNESTTTTLSFATVVISDGTVLNNIDPELNDIEPSDNAKPEDDGISSIVGYNDAVNDKEEVNWQYVHSQQVSSTGVDHKVYVSAAPILILPDTEGDTNIEEYNRTLEEVSDEYTVYTGEGNNKTTSYIRDIPAGLQNIKLKFASLKISEYTQMVIKCVDKAGNVVKDNSNKDAIYTYNHTKSNTTDINLPVQSDEPIDIIVYLESEGQVNDDQNSGYKITGISGTWKSTVQNKFSEVELASTVTWEKNALSYESSEKLPYDQVKEFVSEQYNKDGYSFMVRTPSWPSAAATSYITVLDANDRVVDYYIYSTENKKDENNKYTNTPQITSCGSRASGVDTGLGGIKANEEEVTQSAVGGFSQEGNTLVADSTQSGISSYVGTVTCKLLSNKELTPLNNKVYTSVQWAPIPEKKVSDGTDFYAMATQNIVVKAKLYDRNGNKKTQEDQKISYYYDTEDIDLPKENKVIGKDIEIVKKEEETNEQGEAELKIRAKTGAKILNHLTAKAEGYVVKLEIGGTEVSAANLHWVDVGLSFTDKVQDPQTTIAYNTNKTVDLTDRKVGSNWIFGYNLIGRTSIVDDEDPTSATQNNTDKFYDGKVAVSNVDIDIDKPDNVAQDKFDANPNGIAKMYVEKAGEASLVGGIKSENYDSKVVFVVSDSEGNIIGTYKNVGSGDTAIDSKISLNISWKTNGEKADIIFPWGAKLDMNVASKAYIQVLDNYKNPIPNKKVTYSVGDTVVENAETNKKGLIEIALAAPKKEETIKIKCKDLNIDKQIQYVDTKEVSDLALVNSEAPDEKTLKLTFTNNLSSGLLNKDMFEIKDEAGNKLAIASVVLDSENKNVVTITLDQAKFENTKTYTASTVTKKDNDTDIEYRLVDVYGNIVNADYNVVSCIYGATHSFTDTTKLDNNKLTVGVSEETLSAANPVYVVASNPAVLGNDTGITKVVSNGASITVTPQEAESTITIYYKGISKKFNIPKKGTNN